MEGPIGGGAWDSVLSVRDAGRKQAQVAGERSDVEFDTILGYPTSLYIDQDLRIGDDEQRIVASDVLLGS